MKISVFRAWTISKYVFRLNHHLFGLHPASYHVVNVIFHALVTFLLCFATSYLLQFTKRKSFCVGERLSYSSFLKLSLAYHSRPLSVSN